MVFIRTVVECRLFSQEVYLMCLMNGLRVATVAPHNDILERMKWVKTSKVLGPAWTTVHTSSELRVSFLF
jgi:hypothetical protein